MPAESELFEYKSQYSGTEKERLRLIKTIISMANCQGGLLEIARVTGGMRNLDSAALTSTVNRYVEPPLLTIETEAAQDSSIRIRVRESDRRPHLIKKDGEYLEKGKKRIAFYKGQIWIRHSSSNELADPDDLRAMIYSAAGTLLELFGAKLRTPGFALDPGNPAAIPARLAESPDALLVQADTSAYRHTRKSLVEEFGRPYPWIASAMRRLSLQSPRYAHTDRNSVGIPTLWRYTDSARDVLAKKLEDEPDWDPRLSG